MRRPVRSSLTTLDRNQSATNRGLMGGHAPMRMCRITLDLAYQDDAEDVPKTERSWRALIDRVLDPALGEYMSCTTGVVAKDIAFPDPSSPSKVVAWHQQADRQLALLDVE